MSECQPVEPRLGPEHGQQIISDTDALLDYFPSRGRVKKSKTYKRVCEVSVYEFPDIKFNGVHARVIIEGQPFEKVCQCLLRCTENVDDKSPKQLRKSMLFQKFYFWTKEDEDSFKALLDRAELRNFVFYSHSCGRSPAPAIVKHRDFVVAGRMLFQDGKAALIRRSVEYDGNVSKKMVRSQILCNSFVVTQLGDGRCQLDNYVLVDPCGAVPSGIFNMALDQSCDCAILIKSLAEGTETFEYDQ